MYSRFIEKSLLSQLNKNKKLSKPPEQMVAMLLYAREISLVTNGIFNITVGGVLDSIGYGNGTQANDCMQSDVFWEQVVINKDTISIPASTAIDFGGFGKGWLIDDIANMLTKQGVGQYVINGGGDIFVSSKDSQHVALEHPYNAKESIGETALQNQALAVSSQYKRTWKNKGRTHSHIIDPRTKHSVQNTVAAVYVRAATARVADVVASTILIDPKQKAALEKHYNCQIRIVYDQQLTG